MVREFSDLERPTEVVQDLPRIPEIHPSEVHVLAVDDSVLDRKVIERLLKSLAYKVTTVENGIKALEVLGVEESQASVAVNAFQINLIITDYCMPGMSGFDLLKILKETSGLKEIPVVIMSSENVPNRISRCLAEGAEEFILKPVQLADVRRLRGHVCSSRSNILDEFGVPCTRRKIVSDGLQVQTSERKPCMCGVTVP